MCCESKDISRIFLTHRRQTKLKVKQNKTLDVYALTYFAGQEGEFPLSVSARDTALHSLW